MTAKYILRLDDIAPTMHWDNYFRARALFEKFGVKPIIGVIPQNEDPNLRCLPTSDVDFWEELRQRKSLGWEVAIHGFRHVYDSPESGVLGITHRSEFAGHSFEEQLKRLTSAKEIFNSHNIPVRSFIAPSHSFDENTLKALKQIGVTMISDGYGLYPYHQDGLLFVPQLNERPFTFPFGVLTFCLHLNDISENLFKNIESFLSKHSQDFIAFEDAGQYVSTGVGSHFAHFLSKLVFMSKRKFV